ncbi:mannonate dehydratase [Phaeobacter sp. B1627]|uniref:mannonate dehydratase n=1 Tax=Phaeobacter sp. B1627 TaxID=2583809 RepID=UPI001119405D|nr:mannonate dehydratase [Phaeobacter sp. B1627]TNJ44457.1 mannonate dehydratase [Phaeobacter sp. B1627]
MIESWRWYGDLDKISLSEISQTGAGSIVTALHEIPYGEVWPTQTIAARKSRIEAAGFDWTVVESLPIHESIKRGEGDLSPLFANYRQSMANLASQGIKTICYNFMPLLDWTRTDLAAPVAGGGTCLRFDAVKMCAFELHMLGRQDAAHDYPPDVLVKAGDWYQTSSESERSALLAAIMAGIPGAFERYDIAGLRGALLAYEGVGRDEIRANVKRFLNEVGPAAEDLGLRLAVHPDDPPRDILGLPRIVSDAEDLRWLFSAFDSPANGLTLCSGSLGANPENDVPALAEEFADRIYFAHLRNVAKEADGSFEEAAHLEGDTDMVALIRVLLAEQEHRKYAGHEDHLIPFRPDHGHVLLSDHSRELVSGYPLIGRLRGLAELRGVIRGVAGS